jgi:transcriptional regulator with XRE-family HTH domain
MRLMHRLRTGGLASIFATGWRTTWRDCAGARGFTQRQLAAQCGTCKTYISNIEQGTVNITLANLEALATGLNCTESELLR